MDPLYTSTRLEAYSVYGYLKTYRYRAIRLPFTKRAAVFTGLIFVGFAPQGAVDSYIKDETYGRLYGCEISNLSTESTIWG